MRLGAVILAAGAGARLGGVAKALLPHGADTFLARVARIAQAAGTRELVVVVGPPFGDAVADHARELGLAVAVNPEPTRGMASSVALGFATLLHGAADAAWLWPVDHPAVRGDTLAALTAALGTHVVAQPTYGGRGGHPPLITRAVWPQLVACAGAPGGARAVLAGVDRIAVAVDDPGVVRDVDTPSDRAEVCA